MKLSDKINKNTIIYPLKSTSKNDVLHELLDYFESLDYLTSTTKLFSYLSSKDIDGLMKTIPLYVYFPKSEWKKNTRDAQKKPKKSAKKKAKKAKKQ